MNFSERKGIVQVRTALQKGEMSAQLRALLWNVLHREIFSDADFMWQPSQSGYNRVRGEIVQFARELCDLHFKQPVDGLPYEPAEILGTMRTRFFEASWHGAYDYLEVVLQIYGTSPKLAKSLNTVLERELAGYRVVGGKFVDVLAPEEVASIEAAVNDDRFAGVSTHLRQAIEHVSNRKSPDYRNSIKESISAVESMAQVMLGRKGTLGDALKILEKDDRLHKALKNGFSNLYGYTSDADGIRHAMLDEGTVGAPEAMFFLVSCSAFINFLKSKLAP